MLLPRVEGMSEGLQILLVGILFQRLHNNNTKFWTKKLSFIIFEGLAPENSANSLLFQNSLKI